MSITDLSSAVGVPTAARQLGYDAAMLVTGRAGTGRRSFAVDLTQALPAAGGLPWPAPGARHAAR